MFSRSFPSFQHNWLAVVLKSLTFLEFPIFPNKGAFQLEMCENAIRDEFNINIIVIIHTYRHACILKRVTQSTFCLVGTFIRCLA